jgi:hypothetical protein
MGINVPRDGQEQGQSGRPAHPVRTITLDDQTSVTVSVISSGETGELRAYLSIIDPGRTGSVQLTSDQIGWLADAAMSAGAWLAAPRFAAAVESGDEPTSVEAYWELSPRAAINSEQRASMRSAPYVRPSPAS